MILSFANNWEMTGGVDEYVKWCGGSRHQDFFYSASCWQMYKIHASTVINRVNTINGRT